MQENRRTGKRNVGNETHECKKKERSKIQEKKCMNARKK